MAADMRISAQTVIQFSSVNKGLYMVNTNKERTEDPDRAQIINKIISYMEKHSIFKKKSSTYNEAIHGKLYLMVFYGHIYFTEQKPFPQKFGELQNLITEKNEQIIRFNYANIDELDVPSSSATMKNDIDYEFDCRFNSASSEYFTLLFDKTKTLRQIRIYYIWSKCYIRLPNFQVDNLYEIRSVMTHDAGSMEFDRISNLIFQSQSKDLLKDRKPNFKIDRSLLRSSVIPISLKIIGEDQPTSISSLPSESFFRTVKYVSINEQQGKPKVYSTLEYHVSPISKDKSFLDEICDFVLHPIERASSNRINSASSTASSVCNVLSGFSMNDE